MLTLVRHAYLPNCTLGNLAVGDVTFATMERPWIVNPAGRGGMPSKSCVPDGQYSLFPHNSARFPNVYAIESRGLGVYYQALPPGQTWGRTAILLHVGNFARDVIGCIAIGLRHATVNGEHAVLESGVALDRLRTLLGAERHQLMIRPTAGTT